MKIAIRADVSAKIGSGHLMRTKVLADQFKEEGAEVFYISQKNNNSEMVFQNLGIDNIYWLMQDDTEENAKDYCEWLGGSISADAAKTINLLGKYGETDLLIVDHYSLTKHWQQTLAPFVKKILAIDDLVTLEHSCDFLLDHNFYDHAETIYKKHSTKNTKLLCGEKYALLRKEYCAYEKKINIRSNGIKRILVYFGASDLHGLTLKTLYVIDQINKDQTIDVDIVTGIENWDNETIKVVCDLRSHYSFHCQVSYMSDLMHSADLFIGAGGVTTLERIYMCLPSLVYKVADNQDAIIKYASEKKIVINMGDYNHFNEDNLKCTLLTLLQDKIELEDMSKRCVGVVDTKGPRRIFNAIMRDYA